MGGRERRQRSGEARINRHLWKQNIEKNLEKARKQTKQKCVFFNLYAKNMQHGGVFCVSVQKLTRWWRERSAAWRCCLVCCRVAVWARTATSRSSPPSHRGPTGILFSSCWMPVWTSCVTARQITHTQTGSDVCVSPSPTIMVTSHPARSGSHTVLFPNNGHCLV